MEHPAPHTSHANENCILADCRRLISCYLAVYFTQQYVQYYCDCNMFFFFFFLEWMLICVLAGTVPGEKWT